MMHQYALIIKLVSFLTLFLFTHSSPLMAQMTAEYPSGDAELDRIRQEVKNCPTTRETFKVRAIKMKLWAVTLQQLGVRLDDYVEIDERLSKLVRWNNLWNGGIPQKFTDKQMQNVCKVVDDGYAVLEKYQKTASSENASLAFTSDEEPIDPATQPEIPWTAYKGNENLSGYTGANGPTKGEKAWTFPVGLAWESKPAIEGNRVYLSSPGVRTIMYCVDLNTGEKIWDTKQIIEIMGDQLYHAPSNQSSPVILNDSILFRELGARGNKGPSKHIVFVNKKSGFIDHKMEACHVDYRAGHAPFAANENITVFSYGIQDIHLKPPVTQAFNRVIGKDTKTGAKLWEFITGYTFAEPLLDELNRVYVGTQEGYLYSWQGKRRYGHRPIPQWEFRAGGAINKKPAVYRNNILFGANDGVIYCLDRMTGKKRWEYNTNKKEANAFRHFSVPYAADGKVFIGSADKKVYCLDIASGQLVFEFSADDWVRSAPVLKDNKYYFATLKGSFYGLELRGNQINQLFKKHLGRHAVLADLAMKDDKIVINDSDLWSYCVNTNGDVVWKMSLIESFMKEGNRVLTDQIAGGAYYQSKPTAVNDTVYFGTPMRFVYAVDAHTGKELWKFELGASISGAPTYDDGKIFVGQQGGEDEFYCLDAKTGQKVWATKLDWVWGSATASDGMVYVPGIDGYAWALDAANGHVVWKQPFALSVCSEPAVEGEIVIFGCWDNYLKAFNKKTGQLVWQFNGAGTDSGVAIIKNGRVYVKNKCIDAKTGKLVWEFKDGNNVFNITPAYHDGKVYMSCWHGLGMGGICVEAVVYCINAETGGLIWTQLGAGLSSPVIGGEGNVYFPSIADPYFYSVNSKGNGDGTTKVNWIYPMGNKVEESTPALYKGKAYIMSSDGYIHAIQ